MRVSLRRGAGVGRLPGVQDLRVVVCGFGSGVFVKAKECHLVALLHELVKHGRLESTPWALIH